MIVRKCSTKGAFDAFPENSKQMDLDKIRKSKFQIVADTPFLVIIKNKFEVSCFKSGKLLIKNCTKKEAEKQAKVIFDLVEGKK